MWRHPSHTVRWQFSLIENDMFGRLKGFTRRVTCFDLETRQPVSYSWQFLEERAQGLTLKVEISHAPEPIQPSTYPWLFETLRRREGSEPIECGGSADAPAGGAADEIAWVASDGGPHLVLPEAAARRWRPGRLTGEGLALSPGYLKACELAGPGELALYKSRAGDGLVLGGSVLMSGSIGLADGRPGFDLIVIESFGGLGYVELGERALEGLTDDQMTPLGLVWINKAASLLHFPASDAPGAQVGAAAALACAPGRYGVLTARRSPAPDAHAVVFRIAPGLECPSA